MSNGIKVKEEVEVLRISSHLEEEGKKKDEDQWNIKWRMEKIERINDFCFDTRNKNSG